MKPILELNSVNVKFPISKQGIKSTLSSSILRSKKKIEYYPALTDINLKFFSGDRVGLVGSNGAGKTTLLRVLSGILPPTSGSVKIKGSISALVQRNPSLLLRATCMQNIILTGLRGGLRRDELKQYVESVREVSDMDKFMDSPVSVLSAGMKNRLVLSMLYVKPADIVIMDEWIGTLDERVLKHSEGMLADIIHKSKLFILASHRKGILKSHCTSILKLAAGEIVDSSVGKDQAAISDEA